MKSIVFLVIAFFTIHEDCMSQTNIVPIDAYLSEVPSNSYFKDLFDEMNVFTGTWKYTAANGEVLTIVLEKETMVATRGHYEDLLVGAYTYEVNGTTLVNTLPYLEDTQITGRAHPISGRTIVKSPTAVCDSCTSSERLFSLYFHDPERDYLSIKMVVRSIPNQNTPAKIWVKLYSYSGGMLPDANVPTVARVPYGEYVLEKQ
ncbi:hypothetical protein NBRC110019_32480 [Neptunitalea chrysea]|uniref:DUF6705 domain-containing protein n=1 Tax=Neptunitalea chrysea TaxID=1647581 RepID=A0A9W6B7Y0_9FLAO|nr:DUF6705 family protein [Neptunitalea chrysea]GLB54206.1 hypothetical protein NBRC110019_32480 [Neptunitalea chrysea]